MRLAWWFSREWKPSRLRSITLWHKFVTVNATFNAYDCHELQFVAKLISSRSYVPKLSRREVTFHRYGPSRSWSYQYDFLFRFQYAAYSILCCINEWKVCNRCNQKRNKKWNSGPRKFFDFKKSLKIYWNSLLKKIQRYRFTYWRWLYFSCIAICNFYPS